MFYIALCLVSLTSPLALGAKAKLDPLPGTTLYDLLMSDYHPMIRPSPKPNEKFTIKLALRLSQINFVDEREQILSLSVWLRQEWHDSRLVWDPEEHQGVKILNIPSEEIWIPDLVLYNNADGEFEVTLRTKALVYHTGIVVWEPPAIYKSYCPIDVEFFPFDIQECFLKFSSWTYHGNEVDLQHLCNGTVLNPDSPTPEIIITRGIDLSSYYYNTEWDVLNVTATRRVKFYSCCPDPFPDVTFNLTLRRRPLFYTLNLVMPCIAFLGLTVLVFYLPSASGEKVSLAISILLALTLFFLILTEMNPPTSLVIPLLGKYLLFIFLIVTLSVIITVIIVHINLKTPTTDTMSPWTRRIFTEILPGVLFMKDSEHYDMSSSPSSITKCLLTRCGCDMTGNDVDTPEVESNSQNRQVVRSNNESVRSRKSERESLKMGDEKNSEVNKEKSVDQSVVNSVTSDPLPPPFPLPPEILEAIEEVTWIGHHMKEAEEGVCEERDWKYIGIVLDRLFLWIVGTACFIGTLTICISAPSLYDPREHMSLVDSDNTCIY